MSLPPERPLMTPVDMFRLVRAVSQLLGLTAEQTETAINKYNSEFRTDGGSIRAAFSVRKVVAPVGDGVATVYVVTHSLNTRDVGVTVAQTATPYATVTPSSVERTTVDTVTVTFGSAPAVDEYRVVVVG